MKNLFMWLIFLVCTTCDFKAQIPYPGDYPGQAIVKKLPGNMIMLENDVMKIQFVSAGGKIRIKSFENKKPYEQLNLDNSTLFELIFPDNSVITSNDFKLVKPPVASGINEDPDAITVADRFPGKKYSADLENQKLGLNLHWEAQLRDGSNYIRQVYTFACKDTVSVSKIILIKLPLNIDVRKEGTVDGVPLVHNNMFFALEHPMSQVEKNQTHWTSALNRISIKDSFTASAVMGTTPVNQLRRGFLYYLERERVNPYHQMLHYNSYTDIAWSDRQMNERVCLFRIEMIGDSLIRKRHIQMKAFLFDAGWDDPRTLWQFHSGFPNGFTKLREAAESYGANLGVWISPIGGYGPDGKLRLEYGKNHIPPFETNARGFSLAGPVYYNRYKEVTANFITKYNIAMLKFDGIGAGGGQNGAGIYQRDMEAYLKVIGELRKVKPDLFFLLTIGTWPSPYFLKYGDVIWRQGSDYSLLGEGSKRQQWITYRDADVYYNIVKRSPLYPIAALHCIGIFVSDIGLPGEFGMDEKDISDDFWSAFATGTSNQGLYMNPNRMNTAAWDFLADAIAWAKENESVMADMHWVGGDPAKGEVYGHAAWSPLKAVLSLRNPSKVEKTFEVNVAGVFELPVNMKNEYLFYDAKTGKTPGNKQPVAKGGSFSVTLKPLEVKVFDALPEK